jgi:hypothetical protein
MMCSAAQAAPISFASFGVSGSFAPAVGTHLGNTTGLFIGSGGSISVTSAGVGDLAGVVNVGATGMMADIPSFSSFAPIDNFLSIGGGGGGGGGGAVTLDLSTFTVHSQVGPVPGFINATGTGVLSAPGFDDTSASISLTGTSIDNVSFTIGVTTTASTPPMPVPEPFSAALLGLGLVGAGFAGRRMTRVTTA